MTNQRYELDTRVLAVFFLAAMPFVALGSFLVVNMARSELLSSVGTSLDQRALQTKVAVERYMADQVVHLRLLATDPQVVQTLARQSSPDAEGLSARLRQIVGVRPALHALQIVGARGLVVAATARTGPLDYASTTWWKALSSQPEDRIEPWVGEIPRGASETSTVLEIAYPVRSAKGEWLGAVRGLVDGTDLYAVLAPVRVGHTGHAALVRSSDGLVVAADDNERPLGQPLSGWGSLRSAIEGFPLAEHGQALFGKTEQRRGYWTIPAVATKAENGREGLLEPARLVGFAPVDQVPNVKWLVTVEQDLNEALAPVEGVTRYLWIHFVGVFATVILLALWFSFKLETPVMEEELHLHEEHVPQSMQTSA
ncbi:MAG: cache domain-containing protein [Solirubrobacterales bacterium]